jgi:hypothetical protein
MADHSRFTMTSLVIAHLLILYNVVNPCQHQYPTDIPFTRLTNMVSGCCSGAYALHLMIKINKLSQTRHKANKRYLIFIAIILAGDIELNPGPRTPTFPCGICTRAVKAQDHAVCCDSCNKWIHNRCSGLSDACYEQLKYSSCEWLCPSCGLPNFSDSFFIDSCNITSSNMYELLNYSDPIETSCHIQGTPPPKSKHPIIKVLSVNINGLSGKRLDLEQVIFDHNPDIICCQETKIDGNFLSSEAFPPNYTVIRKDRTSKGGGVCIAVIDRLVAIPCPELDTPTESLWIKIQKSDH